MTELPNGLILKLEAVDSVMTLTLQALMTTAQEVDAVIKRMRAARRMLASGAKPRRKYKRKAKLTSSRPTASRARKARASNAAAAPATAE